MTVINLHNFTLSSGRRICSGLTVLFLFLFSNISFAQIPAATLGYAYEKTLTIDAVSVEGSADFYDFPILFDTTDADLKTTGNGGNVYNANGYDIIFISEAGYRLDHQVEYYDPATGKYTAWIKLDTLFSDKDTKIKIVYGNSQVTDDPSSASTWSSDYAGVWHLSNTSDGTSNANNGTSKNGATATTTAKIGRAFSFNGGNQYIEIPDDASLDLSTEVTLSAWIRPNLKEKWQCLNNLKNCSSPE